MAQDGFTTTRVSNELVPLLERVQTALKGAGNRLPENLAELPAKPFAFTNGDTIHAALLVLAERLHELDPGLIAADGSEPGNP